MIIDYIKCSICGFPIEGELHTSLPVSNGWCCTRCYKQVVKPRVDHFFNELNKIKV